MPNPKEGPGRAATTTATSTTTTTTPPYPHEQYDHFVPSSLAFDGQGQYAKQNVHLTASEYSYGQQQQQQQQQVQQYYDGIQSITQADIGVSDDGAAGLIHSLFTADGNSLDDMHLSAVVGYTPTTASLSFPAPEGTHSPFQGIIQPHHVYGQHASAAAGGGCLLQDMAPFAPHPGADCPTPALIPPTPNTGPSSLLLHPVPLPFSEPAAAAAASHNSSSSSSSQYNSSSEPATPPFLVPSCTAPPMFPTYDAGGLPYDAPLGPSAKQPPPPPPSQQQQQQARRTDQAHSPADLVRTPTLKFPPSQRAAAARAFDHVRHKPNVPIPTAFLGPPLSSAVVMKDGVQRARCLCEGCVGIGDDSGTGDGWRRLDHLWCHMRKEHFGCVVYRCTEWSVFFEFSFVPVPSPC